MAGRKEKKKKYSTLDQIVNALLKKGEFDDNKYRELKDAIKNVITASNINSIVGDYLNKCLAIKQGVSNLLISIDKVNTSGAIEECNKKISSIDNEIKEIDINQIKLGIKIETKKVRTQINNIKEGLKSNIEGIKKRLNQKENRLEEEKKIAQTQKELPDVSSGRTSLDQSSTEETDVVPKRRNSNNKEKRRQEAKRLQKEKEENLSKVKSDFYECLNLVSFAAMFSLFSNIGKLCNEQDGMQERVFKKSCKKFDESLHTLVKNYYTTMVLNQLVRNIDIGYNIERFKECIASIQKIGVNGERPSLSLNDIQSIISRIGVSAKMISAYKISSALPDIKNVEDIRNGLINGQFSNIYEELQKQMAMGGSYNNVDGVHKKVIKNELLFKLLQFDCGHEGKMVKFFERVMEENGYEAEVKKVVVKLIKQLSPNSSIEDASAEVKCACAQARR